MFIRVLNELSIKKQILDTSKTMFNTFKEFMQIDVEIQKNDFFSCEQVLREKIVSYKLTKITD